MEKSFQKDYNINEQNKIYIIGGKGVGKTSLFHLIFSKQFNEDIAPSEIGIIKSNYKFGEKEFTIKEMTDDDNFSNTNKLKNELEDILLILILFSYNDKDSLKAAKNFIEFIGNNLTNNRDLKLVLIGNKYDLIENEAIKESDIQKYVENIDNLSYINISCKNNYNINQIIDMINDLEIEEEKEDEDEINEEERRERVKRMDGKSCIFC